MATDPVDIFLELKDYDGNIVVGESLDAEFSSKSAIEIIEFKFSGDSAESRSMESDEESDDDEESGGRKNRGKKKTKKEKGPLCSFEITKHVDKASTSLMEAYCWTLSSKDAVYGPKYASAKITMRKGGGNQFKFLILTFEDVSVISYDLDVKSEAPEESMKFKFESITMNYYPQKSDGTLDVMCSAEWDFHDADSDS